LTPPYKEETAAGITINLGLIVLKKHLVVLLGDHETKRSPRCKNDPKVSLD
jgi:hypothetical protein